MTTVEPTPQDDMMEESFTEEAVPPADRDDTGTKGTRLSMISKMYDIDGDGKLDKAELAMRNMDTSSRGYLTNDKVYELMQQNFQMQRDLFKFRNVIIWLSAFVVVLTICNLATSFAAAYLAKATATNGNNELVTAHSHQVVSTQTTANFFEIERVVDEDGDENGRNLCTTSGGIVTCGSFDSYVSMPRSEARAMICMCKKGLTVNLKRTWRFDGSTSIIPLCPPPSGVSGTYDAGCNDDCTECSGVGFSNGVAVMPKNIFDSQSPYTIVGDAITQDHWQVCDETSDCDTTQYNKYKMNCLKNRCRYPWSCSDPLDCIPCSGHIAQYGSTAITGCRKNECSFIGSHSYGTLGLEQEWAPDISCNVTR